MRKRRTARLVLAAMVSLLSAGPPAAFAQHGTAAARIEAMANFLAKAERLSVVADCTWDVLQDSGEKIEFGERRQLTLRRPDRARVDATRRDGSRHGLIFDGTQLTTFDLDAKVYATVSKGGSLDAALDYYTDDLKMRLPLRELFASDLPRKLKDVADSARLVDPETIAGTATDHVAFRGDAVDVQLWIARNGDPLPQRIVITYRLAGGQPQFAANFSEWNFSPDVPDSAFAFVAPPDAEKIPILTRGQRRDTREKDQ
jgi:hypothetical protein